MEFLSNTDIIVLSLGTLILGMVILIKGGGWTIDGAVEIAHHYGMPPLLVGFTIVAFGTSLPELIASINANIKGYPSIAVGGMIGSNISNILLVIGVSAFIMPLSVNIKTLRNDFIMLAITSIAWSYLLAYHNISWAIGVTSIGLLIAYIVFQYHASKSDEHKAKIVLASEQEAVEQAPVNHGKAIMMVIGGLIGLALGAELLIRGAVTTARIVGIKESVIGLTLVALGTSLPELTTCAMAALKKQADIIIGNIIGSNIFNLMMVLGGIGIIKTYGITDTEPLLIAQDIPFMLGVTAAFMLTLIVFKKIPRPIGLLYSLAYVGYMVLLTYQSL